MAKDKSTKDKAPSLADLRVAAHAAADAEGMVTVKAIGTLRRGRRLPVSDNGHRYEAGQIFHMHEDLVPAHVRAGQVEIVAA